MGSIRIGILVFLLAAAPARADDSVFFSSPGPRPCPEQVAGKAASPWYISATKAVALPGVVCGVTYAGYSACRLLYERDDLRNAALGMAIVLAVSKGLSVAKRLVAPQYEFLQQWLNRGGYSFNGWLVAKIFGLRPRNGIVGDTVSPNIYSDINGRFSNWQAITAGKIASISRELDWQGWRAFEMLQSGEVELAANQFVTSLMIDSYIYLEVLRRTVGADAEPRVRAMVLRSLKGYVTKKLEKVFERESGLRESFRLAVEEALAEIALENPSEYRDYGQGIRIVLGDLMPATFTDGGKDWVIRFPETDPP